MTAPAPQPQHGPPGLGAPEVPVFGLSRLLVVVTGSAAAGAMPQWLTWLRSAYPELGVKVVMSRSAERFVTPMSLRLRLDEDVLIDSWDDCERARHVEHAEWAEAVVVHPATFHFTARFALGLADTPALLTLQCTDALVALAPALPPGGLESRAFQQHWASLAADPRVVLVPPIQGYSLTTGQEDSWVPPPLPEVLRRIENRRLELGKETGRPARTSAREYAATLADGARS
ncbi:flavoprotein [Streptomyces sp. NPDC048392]|uniref:flavoprotein n=1 Tax=Streptomyces sp. NPDC048392 TaxID=3365543 RepID=UPI003712CBDE